MKAIPETISALELMEMEFPILSSEKIKIQSKEYVYLEQEHYLSIQNMDGKEISYLFFANPKCPLHVEDYIIGRTEKIPSNLHKLNSFPQYELCELVTCQEYRKRGLATFLLNKMIGKYGKHNIYGYVAPYDIKYLKKFYRKFGFIGNRDDNQLIVRYKMTTK